MQDVENERKPADLDVDYNSQKVRMLEKLKGADLTKPCIFSGAQPDPDGLASMYTLSAILEMWGYSPVCFYRGSFTHPQNRIIRQVLGLSPKPESEFIKEEYTCIISVDGPASVCPVVPDFIIDHHEQSEPAKIASDVRNTGSCSSILWNYAMEANLNWLDEQGQKLATALAIGIKTDTRDCASDSTSSLDYEAYNFCLQHKDNKLYKEIMDYDFPSYYNDLFVIGWENKIIENSVLVTGIGYLSESRGASLAYLAEKFCQTEGVSTTVVFAIVQGCIDISVRSSNSALSVDEFVRSAFGGGGGKSGAGRAKLAVPLFNNIASELGAELFEVCFKIVKQKALQIAGDK